MKARRGDRVLTPNGTGMCTGRGVFLGQSVAVVRLDGTAPATDPMRRSYHFVSFDQAKVIARESRK